MKISNLKSYNCFSLFLLICAAQNIFSYRIETDSKIFDSCTKTDCVPRSDYTIKRSNNSFTEPLFGCSNFTDCEPEWNKFDKTRFLPSKNQLEVLKLEKEYDLLKSYKQIYQKYLFENAITIKLTELAKATYKIDTDYVNFDQKSVSKKSNHWTSPYSIQASGILIKDIHHFHLDDHRGMAGFTGVLQIPVGADNTTNQTQTYRNIAIVLFRGTESFEDFKNIISTNPKNEIYTGFYERFPKYGLPVFKNLANIFLKYKKLNDANPDIQSKITDVIFSGHSIGGADATVAPILFKRIIGDKYQKIPFFKTWRSLPKHVITFAAPKPGTKKFSTEVKNTVTFYRRYENIGDPIPMLPVCNGLDACSSENQYCHPTKIASLIYEYQGKFNIYKYQYSNSIYTDIFWENGGLGFDFDQIVGQNYAVFRSLISTLDFWSGFDWYSHKIETYLERLMVIFFNDKENKSELYEFFENLSYYCG